MALLITKAQLGCGESGKLAEDRRMAAYVDATINDLVKPDTARQGLDVLSVLPPEAAPYVVARLGDSRSLPVTTMVLQNRAPGRFEATWHTNVRTVDDALTQGLAQIAGKQVADWRSWCVPKYPEKAQVCNGASPR